MNKERIKEIEAQELAKLETSVDSKTTQERSEDNVTNVYNATVNNTNVFYSTMACINYMRENRKALIIPAIVTLVIFTMLGISIASLNRSLRMYSQAQTVSADTLDKMNALTERNEQLEKAVNEALESSQNAATAADEARKQAEDSVKKLSAVANQPKQSINDDKPIAAETESNPEAATVVEDVDPTIYLNKMTIVSNYNAKKEKTINNSLGDEFKDAIVINGYGGGYVTYYLGGKYTKFKGNVCCPEDHSITKKYPLTIYANDDKEQELYSMDFGRNTAITPIELDVTGVEFLTFRVHIDTVLGNYAGVIISDGTLE